MKNDQDQPDSNDEPKGTLLAVRLVLVAATDARRRLAAAIEMLIRAGAKSQGDDSQDRPKDN